MSVAAYDQDISPSVQAAFPGPYYAQVDGTTFPRRCFHHFAGVPYAHDMTYLQRFAATARAGLLGGGAQRVIETTIPINSSIEFQGRLFMGGYSTGSVVNWDGIVVLTEATIATAPLIMGVLQETLLAFGTHTCKKRNLDGTWSVVAMPGGITSFVPRCAIQHLNKLYIGGFDNATSKTGLILVYDGATLAVARTVAGSSNSQDVGCTDIALMNGKMYYAHNDVATAECKIGQFDGTNWIDDYKDMAAQLGGAPTIGCLSAFRGSLYVGMGIAGGGSLYKSPGPAIDGTYSLIATAFTGLYDFLLVEA